MRKLQILPDISVEMADGTPFIDGNRPATLSQRGFMLRLLDEPGFARDVKGIHAARAVDAAKREIERAFQRVNGELSDEVWEKLNALLETVNFSAGRGGPSINHCLLPFMEALAAAEYFDPTAPVQAAAE